MRVLNIIFYGLLLALLIASVFIYLYACYQDIQDWAGDQQLLSNILDPIFRYAKNRNIEPKELGLGGIGLVVLLIFAYFLPFLKDIGKKLVSSRFTAFFVLAILVMGGGLITTIYYWPHDVIRLGNLFKLHRGPRDKFLGMITHLAIMVVVAHLFFFLLINFVRWIFWKPKTSLQKVKKKFAKKENEKENNNGERDSKELSGKE